MAQKTKANGFTAKRISIVNLDASQTVSHDGEVMTFLSKGNGIVNDERVGARTLLRSHGLDFEAETSVQLILIYTN